MKRKIMGLLALIASVILSSCASKLIIGDYAYRRAGAQYATIGAIGYKNTHGSNIFEPYHRLNLEGIDLMLVSDTVQKIDVQKSFGTKIAAKVADANATGIYKNIREGRYKVLTILDRDKLIDRINTLPWNDRHPFRIKSGRIITSIVLVYNGKESQYKKFEADLKNADTIKLLGDGTKIEVKGSSITDRTIRIADGDVIAYEYCKPLFKGQDNIVQLKTDRISWFVLSK